MNTWQVITPRQGVAITSGAFIRVNKSTVYFSRAAIQRLGLAEGEGKVVLAQDGEKVAIGTADKGASLNINPNTGSGNIYSAPVLRLGVDLGKYYLADEPTQIEGNTFFILQAEADE